VTFALVRFGAVPLPDHMVMDDLSTPLVDSALLDSAGGVFDAGGTAQRRARRHLITTTGQYVGEETALVTESGDQLRVAWDTLSAGHAAQMAAAQVTALKAKVGAVDVLWRRRDGDGVEAWKRARLLQVRHQQGQERVAHIAPLECQFESAEPVWRGAARLATVNAIAGRPAALWGENGGDVEATDAILTVTASAGAVTAVSVTGPGVAWTWTGTLAAGQSLVVDAGARTVTAAGVAAYSGFARGGGHTATTWLPLPPGRRLYTVYVTGANATLSLAFDEPVL
jgi:hypothetical protein